MTDKENAMYGMSVEDIREDYMESLTAHLSGLEMVVAGILYQLPRNDGNE